MSIGGAGIPLRELAIVLLCGAVATYLCTGMVRSLLMRSNNVAAPRARDVHAIPIPRLGGVAMFTGFLFAILMASQLPALNRGFPPITPDMRAVMISASIIVVVGAVDDLKDLPWFIKLGAQLLASVLMSILGVSWYFFSFGFGQTYVLDQLSSTVVTALFTVTIINAMNFVDGLDGLAAGLGFIAAISILIYSMTILYDQGGTVSAYPPAMISAALAGVCLGFLPHNFAPARIFMGDSGSMLIGTLLAASCVSATGRTNMALYGPADALALISPLIVVLAALSVPILDLFLAVVRRVAAGKSPFAPDKQHLHHRLLRLGHSHRRVAVVLYTWVTVVAFGAIGATVFPMGFIVLSMGVAIIGATIITMYPRLREVGASLRTKSGSHNNSGNSDQGHSEYREEEEDE